MLRAGADPDQRALNEINSFDGPLLIADIVQKIKNIRDFAGKKKRGLAKLDPQNYDDMGPGPVCRTSSALQFYGLIHVKEVVAEFGPLSRGEKRRTRRVDGVEGSTTRSDAVFTKIS